MIYQSFTFKCMIRGLNVPIVHLNAKRNWDLFWVDILRYKRTIDAQLKFSLFPVMHLLNTTLIHKKYILYPT